MDSLTNSELLQGLIVLVLSVNAWFTRETLLRIVKIEVGMSNNSTKIFYMEKQMNSNTDEIGRIRDWKHMREGTIITMEKHFDHLVDQEINNGR